MAYDHDGTDIFEDMKADDFDMSDFHYLQLDEFIEFKKHFWGESQTEDQALKELNASQFVWRVSREPDPLGFHVYVTYKRGELKILKYVSREAA